MTTRITIANLEATAWRTSPAASPRHWVRATGRGPKRELYEQLHAFVRGLEIGKGDAA